MYNYFVDLMLLFLFFYENYCRFELAQNTTPKKVNHNENSTAQPKKGFA